MSATASADRRPPRRGAGRLKPARRTLRGRVSLLGLVVITAWVIVLTAGFNLVLSQRLDHEIDSVLHTRATTAAATVNVGASGRVTVAETSGDEALDSSIWVFASGGRVVEAPRADARVQAEARQLSGRDAIYRTSGDYRLYARSVRHDGSRVATVVALVSTEPYERARLESLVGSGLVALLVLIGAYPVLRFAAGRALRPVDSMARQAGEWSAHALTERFGENQRYREVSSLAGRLDSVLDRLSAVVRHERQLSAELSHELRTPLSRIVAETDLLMSRPHSADELTTAHRAVRDSAMAMERILETLLSAARVDILHAPGRCDLAAVVTGLAHTHAADGRASIAVEIPSTLSVGLDAPIIERILAPILDNACRYAREKIVVSAVRSGDAVLVDIVDDGPGVPADQTESIFEPGHRGSVDDGHDGAGLGLALARRLARAASGEVTVAGPGSRFRIRLPPA